MSTVVKTRHNLATNPSFETSSGTVAVRTNLAPNPRGVNAYQNYASGVGTITPNVTPSTPTPDQINTANRVAWNANDNNPGVIFMLNPAANTTYTMSAWVYVETAGSALGFAQNGVAGSPTLTPTTGQWSRLSWTYTTGTSTNGFGLRYAGAQAASGSFLITGVLVEATNVLGPYFDGGQPAALRTNYAPNPSFEVNTNNTAVAGTGTMTLAVDSSTFYVGSKSLKVTTDGSATAQGVQNLTGPLPIGSYACSLWVKGPAGTVVYPQIRSNGATNQDVTGANVTLNGGWQQLSATITTTQYSTSLSFMIRTASAVAVTFNIDAVLIEAGSTVGAYFDGGTAADPGHVYGWYGAAGSSVSYQADADLTPGWTSGANASTSQLSAPNVATIGVGWGAGVLYQTAALALYGSKAAKYLSQGTQTFVAGIGTAQAATVSPGDVVTLSYYVNPSVTRTFRTIAHYDTGTEQYGAFISAPAGQWTRISGTVTAPAGVASVRLLMDTETAAAFGDTYLFDGMLVEPGAVLGAYFDGDTPDTTDNAYSPAASIVYSWDGPQGASASTMTETAPLQNYQLQLPDGTITGAGQPVGFTGITNLRGSGEYRDADEDVPDGDGSIPGFSYVSGKTVGITFTMVDPAGGMEAGLASLTRNWQNLTDPGAAALRAGDYLLAITQGTTPTSALQVQLPGRAVPLLAIGRPGKLDVPVDTNYQYGYIEVPAEWSVPDGLTYDATVNGVTANLPQATSVASFPLAFPINWGTSSGGQLTAVNAGNYPAKPVFVITGPVTNPKITDTTTGLFFKLNLTLQRGDTVTVNMQSRVVRLNGANRNNAVDPSSTFLSVPPGGSSLSFSSSDSTNPAPGGQLTVLTLNTYSTV